jgi:hypothetical protein
MFEDSEMFVWIAQYSNRCLANIVTNYYLSKSPYF